MGCLHQSLVGISMASRIQEIQIPRCAFLIIEAGEKRWRKQGERYTGFGPVMRSRALEISDTDTDTDTDTVTDTDN